MRTIRLTILAAIGAGALAAPAPAAAQAPGPVVTWSYSAAIIAGPSRVVTYECTATAVRVVLSTSVTCGPSGRTTTMTATGLVAATGNVALVPPGTPDFCWTATAGGGTTSGCVPMGPAGAGVSPAPA